MLQPAHSSQEIKKISLSWDCVNCLQFKIDFIERVRLLVVGPPSDESTQIGALVSKTHFEKVMSYLNMSLQPIWLLYLSEFEWQVNFQLQI